jgi:TM2 domain-containing membrane protein YozV
LLLLPAVCFSDEQEAGPDRTLEYFSSENILGFADYLYLNGDYLRAAGEYQRYLLSIPRSASSDSIYYRMIKAVFLGKDFQRCNQLLDTFTEEYPTSPRVAVIPLCKCITKFYQKNYSESLALGQIPAVSNTDLGRIVVAMDYLYLGDFENAQKWSCGPATSEVFTTKDTLSEYDGTITRLCENIKSTESLAFKSKLVAGFYSSLIPGTGKIYCGRIADGIYSFLIVGLTAWQAYDGFSDDGVRSTKGWVFGTLGAGFYLANIYGSVIAVELHNRKIHDGFLQGLQVDITLP